MQTTKLLMTLFDVDDTTEIFLSPDAKFPKKAPFYRLIEWNDLRDDRS